MNVPIIENISSKRQQEIVDQYLLESEKHLQELKKGTAENTLEIKDLAEIMCIHPTHLSNTIQKVLGKSPCDIYEERLFEISKELLSDFSFTITQVAHTLTFDPSNFTKFFKSYSGLTPKKFREQIKTEVNTIL